MSESQTSSLDTFRQETRAWLEEKLPSVHAYSHAG